MREGFAQGERRETARCPRSQCGSPSGGGAPPDGRRRTVPWTSRLGRLSEFIVSFFLAAPPKLDCRLQAGARAAAAAVGDPTPPTQGHVPPPGPAPPPATAEGGRGGGPYWQVNAAKAAHAFTRHAAGTAGGQPAVTRRARRRSTAASSPRAGHPSVQQGDDPAPERVGGRGEHGRDTATGRTNHCQLLAGEDLLRRGSGSGEGG